MQPMQGELPGQPGVRLELRPIAARIAAALGQLESSIGVPRPTAAPACHPDIFGLWLQFPSAESLDLVSTSSLLSLFLSLLSHNILPA